MRMISTNIHAGILSGLAAHRSALDLPVWRGEHHRDLDLGRRRTCDPRHERIHDLRGWLLARTIPMPTHLLIGALGIILAASPWLFGFADHGTNAWLPFLLIGLGEIGAALTTERQPREALGRRHARA
jgi:hypothetical protein